LGSVLRRGLEPFLGLATATGIARSVSLGLFGLVAAGALVVSLRARTERQLFELTYVTLLAAALLATTWFQAWYVVWPFAFAAALPIVARHVEVALLSLGGLLQYLVFIYMWVIGVFPPVETFALQATAYLAIIGPPLLGVAWMNRPRYARVYTHSEETACAD